MKQEGVDLEGYVSWEAFDQILTDLDFKQKQRTEEISEQLKLLNEKPLKDFETKSNIYTHHWNTFDFFSALMIDKGAAHMRLARF